MTGTSRYWIEQSEHECGKPLPIGSCFKCDMLQLERERDELRNALSLAGKLCHQVHHSKSMQHGAFEPCPVEALIQQALYKAQ
jgi:hypothetical protein